MINDVIIIDDIIPTQYQDAIENFMLGEGSIPWYLQNDITYAGNSGSVAGIERKYPAFAHVFKNEDGFQTQKLDFVLPLAFSACEKINFKINAVLRVRSFLQLPTYLPLIKNNPHVDMAYDHLVCLYYVNDSQGPTSIYEEKYTEIPMEKVGTTNFHLLKEVEPKKGRCVLFNGMHYHASSTSMTDKRCILNFDII
jgi:hypothetical protein